MFTLSPATVATSTTSYAVSYGFQRKGFHAAGLFWAFYSDGTNAGWETSADGVDWSGAFTSIGACTLGYYFSVWFDGTYIHYARYDNFDLFYRRGTPENDGSITWCDDEQTVYNGSSGDEYNHPCISVDTNGYAWIGVRHYDGANYTPYVLKNANNNGTWATDFATQLNAADSPTWMVCPVPLTGGKVYVIYCMDSQLPLGQPWDAGWGAEENDLADYAIEKGYEFSAVALDDNVHLVYNKVSTHQIRHNERVWGVGWDVNDVLVQQAGTTYRTGPALSADPSTGDLYCFWTDRSPDHVYYKQYTGGAWDVAATDWIDESVDDIAYDFLISSFYMDYGGYIGLLYVTLLASPYNVRFAFLTTPPEGWTGKISGVVDPAKIMGVAVADIAEVKGVA